MADPARHASRTRERRRRVLPALGVVLVLFLGSGVVTAGWVVHHLQGNITAEDITDRLGTDRPTMPVMADDGRPLNVLVVGSDSRMGANGFVGGKADLGRSDTTMLLHVSGGGRRAVGVSIPRDSMVRMPTCVNRDGGTSPARLRQFNDAYTIGGAACTVRTVEQLTGIRIDHYVVIDFAGFKDMVDALGGVEVCLPKAVNDVRHDIRLPAGRSRLDGEQALSYVRERYALGDGGDLSRIGRQQAFLAAVLQQATEAGTLADPVRLYSFLDAATKSVTMDPQLASLTTLAGLAGRIRSIGLDNITFVTVPTGTYPADRNRLVWTPAADDLWQAIRLDRPVGATAAGVPTGVGAGAGAQPSPTARPATPTTASPPVRVTGEEARSAAGSICTA